MPYFLDAAAQAGNAARRTSEQIRAASDRILQEYIERDNETFFERFAHDEDFDPAYIREMDRMRDAGEMPE